MIDETFLTSSFLKRELPPFPCPTCGASLVADTKDWYREKSSKDSRDFINKTGELEAESGTFTLWLQCSRKSCRESVCCIGSYGTELVNRDDGEHLESSLNPLFFHPTVPIFPYPNGLPDRIAAPLKDSFSLFWSNPAAAGNALRVALERIMDHLRITKLGRSSKGKRVRLNLHDRINHFGKKPVNAQIAEKLLALKWLGNHGSHTSGLNHQDLIHAFRLLEYVLEELFQKRVRTLAKLAAQINRRKGP